MFTTDVLYVLYINILLDAILANPVMAQKVAIRQWKMLPKIWQMLGQLRSILSLQLPQLQRSSSMWLVCRPITASVSMPVSRIVRHLSETPLWSARADPDPVVFTVSVGINNDIVPKLRYLWTVKEYSRRSHLLWYWIVVLFGAF